VLRDAKVVKVNPAHHSVDIEFRSTSEIIPDVKIAGRVYWNLQPGDYVLVGYIESNDNPVVLDKVLLHGDPRIEGSERDDIHLIHEVGPRDDKGILTEVTGKIEVHTDTNGNLTLTLSGELGSLNIKAQGKEGKINIEAAGDTTIISDGNVYVGTDGSATVTAKGNISATADGDISAVAKGTAKVDGATVELGDNLTKLLVNNLPVCIITGAKHSIGNKNVKA